MFKKVFYKSVQSIMAGLAYVAEELESHSEQCLFKAEATRQHIKALQEELLELDRTALDAAAKAKALRGILNA